MKWSELFFLPESRNIIGTVFQVLIFVAACWSLDSMPGHSNWGLTNQRREESRDHTNALFSLVNSKSNVGGHCQVTCKAQYTLVESNECPCF